MLDVMTLKNTVLAGSAIFLSMSLFICLMRSLLGPRYTDRIISAGMFGTHVIVLLAVIAVILGQDYLADICLISAIVIFLAVVILSRSVLENKEDTE